MADTKTTKKESKVKEVKQFGNNEVVVIEIIKDTKHLKKGKVHTVSGNVANILISKKEAKAK